VKIYYDTEFLERGPEYPIDLISIGMVTEDGREFYGINGELVLRFVAQHPWLMENVVPNLPVRVEQEVVVWASGDQGYQPRLRWDDTNPDGMQAVMSRAQLAAQVRTFLMSGPTPPELWAWYGAYAHVVFAQLWGTMAQLPDGIPMWTNDLRHEVHRRGNLRVPVQKSGIEHHALADARWNRDVDQWLAWWDSTPREVRPDLPSHQEAS